MRRAVLILAALLTFAVPAIAGDPFDDIVQPYAARGAFSGAVLVVRDGDVVFDRAYGMADAEQRIANQTTTRFHVGTLSMTYTAAMVLRLVELHRINLDNTAGQFVPGLDARQGGLSVQDLLAVNPDATEAAADYTLLARVASSASGRTFADAADHTVFASVLLTGTGMDDGTLGADRRMAKGYRQDGSPVPPPDWASLTGAASAYTTTRGEFHWLEMLFGDSILTPESRAVLSRGPAGYGWFHDTHLSQESFWAQGRAPGFTSYVLWLPQSRVSVVVLANVETDMAAKIGDALAVQADRGPAGAP